MFLGGARSTHIYQIIALLRVLDGKYGFDKPEFAEMHCLDDENIK